MTNALIGHMDESNEQMVSLWKVLLELINRRWTIAIKLNEEFRRIEVLTYAERRKVAMKLVRDSDLLHYFFTLEDDVEKETFLV